MYLNDDFLGLRLVVFKSLDDLLQQQSHILKFVIFIKSLN